MAKRTPKEVVWTKFLTERTLLRAWYILENNYFKGTIKRILEKQDDQVKVSYGKCHNCLYQGLYFPNEEFGTGEKPLPRIKEAKGITTKSSVIANTMPPYEILKNIHAMHTAAVDIIDYFDIYDCDDCADKFYELCYNAGQDENKYVITDTTYGDSKAITPIRPNCYRFVKKIKKDLKLGRTVGTVYSESDNYKQSKFDKALNDYNKARNRFVNDLSLRGTLAQNTIKTIIASIDNGLYCSMIGNIGFDMDVLTKKDQPEKYLSRKDLQIHTKKFNRATKELKIVYNTNVSWLAKRMHNLGQDLREDYLRTHKAYPECNKGFYNAFAEMLAQNFEYQELKQTQVLKNYPQELEDIIKEMKSIRKMLFGTDLQQKKEAMDKIDKIKEIIK